MARNSFISESTGRVFFWLVKAGHFHGGRKTLLVGLSPERVLSLYPKTKHSPSQGMRDCRRTSLHGLGSIKKNGLLPKALQPFNFSTLDEILGVTYHSFCGVYFSLYRKGNNG